MKRRLAIGLMLLAVLISAFMFWLLASESGLRWSYQQALQYLPETLSVTGPSGRLIGPLGLQAIRFENKAQTIEARQVILDWNPWGLLQDNIDFSQLQVASLDIALTENTVAEEQPFSMPHVSLPLGLRIHNAEINAISIHHGNNNCHNR